MRISWIEKNKNEEVMEITEKIPTKNNQEKDNFNFWAYKQS